MFGTIRELWVALANYVHWCNNFRLHSTLGYTVQAEFKKADLVLSEYSKEVQLIRSVSSKGLLEDTIVGLRPALSGRFAALKTQRLLVRIQPSRLSIFAVQRLILLAFLFFYVGGPDPGARGLLRCGRVLA